MHAPLVWWNKEKIVFYKRAAKETSFHHDLAKEIENYLDKNKSILELGAGLGYITEILKNDGYEITALENDEEAVIEANSRSKDLLIKEDAYSTEKRGDILLLIFFGLLKEREDLSYLFSLAKEKIIYIISRHKANPYSQKRDRRDEVIDLLDREKIDYELKDITLDFSQPLRDEEDARLFFLNNYQSPNIPKLEENRENNEFPLLFRNKKEMTIFIINKEKR